MYKQLLKMLMMPLKYLENPIVNGALKIFLVFYAAAVAPKLPSFISRLFQNSIVKMYVLFLVSYVGIKDPVMSLMIAVAFTLTMLSLNKMETLSDVHNLLDAVIDVPQELLNELVDGTQEIVDNVATNVDNVTGVVGLKLAKPVVNLANNVVDVAQNLSNKVIDTTQSVVSDVVGVVVPKKQEQFSMEQPDYDNFEMGKIGDIQGSDLEVQYDNVLEEELIEEVKE